MKLWMSGEIQADVADANRETRRIVQTEINRLLEGVVIADNIDQWAFIAIIRAAAHPDFDEVVQRTNRGKVLEFRLKIPHGAFLSATPNHRISLVLEALSRSVTLMSQLKVSADTQDALQKILLEAKKNLL